METIEDDVKKLLAGEILSISEVDTGIDNASKNNIKLNAYHTNYMFSIITHNYFFGKKLIRAYVCIMYMYVPN